MPLTFVNCREQTYYLIEGKTKTGKPKYYASRKPTGNLLDKMPEGFEFYEQPERAIVSVRKIAPSSIRPEERDQLSAWTREYAGLKYFRVEIKGDNLIVYSPAESPDRMLDVFSRFTGLSATHVEAKLGSLASVMHYTAMFRFTLIDEEKRLFSAARWCFRGAIDDWFPLDYGKPLATLAKKLLPHLNKESFFELM